MSGRRRHHDEPVVEITSAPTSPREELAGRERRYMISMGIRTLCFVGAVIAFGTHLPWLGGVLLLGSLVLPVVAVIIANSMSPRIEGTPLDPGLHHHELGARPHDEHGDR